MSKNVALLVAEAPWFSFKTNHDQASCIPFFEGVKKLVNDSTDKPQLNIYNCNYYDNKSLEKALEHLVDTREDIQILYIGGHGDGKRIADATINKTTELIREHGKKIKGLIVSSCMAGLTDKLSMASEGAFSSSDRSISWVNGPNWIISYKYAVDWFPSALVETSIVRAFTEHYHQEGRLNSKADILGCLNHALAPFDLHQEFASDKSDNRKSLGDTIRIWIRAQGSSQPTDMTEDLLAQLGYLEFEAE
ncbi:hypothetical protein ACOSZP_15345 [Vibrio fluvialis]|uniref:hypothetical protein n=1 Tax=Vibrio fluvialis TaxID=676 RepID=UPI003B9EF9E7